MRNRHTMPRTAAAVAASALIALGLAACSGSGDAEDGSSDPATAAEQSAEETPEESPAEDAAEETAEEDGSADAAAGGDVCTAFDSLTSASSALGSADPSDLQPTLDKLEEVTTTLEDVTDPPAEIADDWGTLTTSFRSVTDGLSEAAEDPSDPDAMTKVNDAMSTMTGQEFQDSVQAVGTYAGTNC